MSLAYRSMLTSDASGQTVVTVTIGLQTDYNTIDDVNLSVPTARIAAGAFIVPKGGRLKVDWGDGTPLEEFDPAEGSAPHAYSHETLLGMPMTRHRAPYDTITPSFAVVRIRVLGNATGTADRDSVEDGKSFVYNDGSASTAFYNGLVNFALREEVMDAPHLGMTIGPDTNVKLNAFVMAVDFGQCIRYLGSCTYANDVGPTLFRMTAPGVTSVSSKSFRYDGTLELTPERAHLSPACFWGGTARYEATDAGITPLFHFPALVTVPPYWLASAVISSEAVPWIADMSFMKRCTSIGEYAFSEAFYRSTPTAVVPVVKFPPNCLLVGEAAFSGFNLGVVTLVLPRVKRVEAHALGFVDHSRNTVRTVIAPALSFLGECAFVHENDDDDRDVFPIGNNYRPRIENIYRSAAGTAAGMTPWCMLRNGAAADAGTVERAVHDGRWAFYVPGVGVFPAGGDQCEDPDATELDADIYDTVAPAPLLYTARRLGEDWFVYTPTGDIVADAAVCYGYEALYLRTSDNIGMTYFGYDCAASRATSLGMSRNEATDKTDSDGNTVYERAEYRLIRYPAPDEPVALDLDKRALTCCSELKELPRNMRDVGTGAFYNCLALEGLYEELAFDRTLRSVGYGAFWFNSVNSVRHLLITVPMDAAMRGRETPFSGTAFVGGTSANPAGVLVFKAPLLVTDAQLKSLLYRISDPYGCQVTCLDKTGENVIVRRYDPDNTSMWPPLEDR